MHCYVRNQHTYIKTTSESAANDSSLAQEQYMYMQNASCCLADKSKEFSEKSSIWYNCKTFQFKNMGATYQANVNV